MATADSYTECMPQYLLTCAQPRLSFDGAAVVYEVKPLRAEHRDDSAAIRWARAVVPYECGLSVAGEQRLARPMVLWALQERREVVWEYRPGAALQSPL